ncbi:MULTISPECIES: TonB-dependent receptor plug domain-containing protein [Arenibacter]|uniref:TonB-dependent receptor plug domain-containing protein n=1 Tax=Arenibacter TaxID=178469 RepID=UPI000CD3DC09|nr:MULTISPECIES: TonB-dependent receptor plug domain-containing protein [Arenibacter]
MKSGLAISFFILNGIWGYAQEHYRVMGIVKDMVTQENIVFSEIEISGFTAVKPNPIDGRFNISSIRSGDYILTIYAQDYLSKIMPVSIGNQDLDLGIIYLERDIAQEKTDNLITLTDSDLVEDESISMTSGMLQATKDIFLNRAAFDFGQAFFRVRGYGSENGRVLLNGIPMNKLVDGRPQWNNWGGLNDITRNQVFTHGLQASDFSFGGILGTTNISTRPSAFRKGMRLSTSASNRTYAGRFMATYTSVVPQKDIYYSVSASRRWAKEGYIDGTLYDAYSFFGALEYQLNDKHSIGLTSIMASNRRGRSSAVTEEVFQLAGKRYNPYWGNQNGKIRNSRERKIVEPIFMLNHYYNSRSFNLNTGISYQVGSNSKSRLGYYNAPNPDPTYYRYLPSFYINSPIGANFIGANTAKEGFLENPQLNWNNLYNANASVSTQGKAVYIAYEDTENDQQFNVATIGNYDINSHLKLDFGGYYTHLESDNYAEINDLLGADYHEDIDPFSNTKNDVDGNLNKTNGNQFNYLYNIKAGVFDAFSQWSVTYPKWGGFLGINYTSTKYQRDGKFKNERFLNASFGKGDEVTFSNFGAKGGITYKFNGRHWVILNGAYLNKPPVYQNVFINPRENNQIVKSIQSEKITTTDLNYFIRLPNLMGRVTGYYTRFQNTTDINFFFVDAGVGSDFVQEVLTDLDKLHLGTELGLEYQLSSAVKLSLVAAVGKFLYASDPLVSINFDTAGAEEEILNPIGNIDLGIAEIKDYKLAQGPQKALAFGVEYRDPKYWWVGTTANFLGNNYAGISAITRTQSFYLDPETGVPFPNATDENVKKLLSQNKLDDFYLLNMVGGKSWLKGGRYISVFASVNNVFDAIFRTGGYEQSRNGNFGQLQQDNLSGNPSFAPKYWYGYGRTYFINFAISF